MNGSFIARLCAAISMMLVVCASAVAEEAEYVIRFSHVVAPNTPKGRAADLFAKLVNERLAGKVRVEVYPNSELYDDDTILPTLLLNSNEHFAVMAAPSLSKFLQFSEMLQVFDLPFLFRNVEDVHKVTESPLVEEIIAPLEEKGFKALAFWDNGMKEFSVKADKPLRVVPDDFQGKRFRIQNSNVHAAMIEDLGGMPERLPFRVVYMSLNKGIVDGQENAWSNIYSQKFHTVQHWITVSDHSYLGYLVVVSNPFWKGLPEDIRGQLEAMLREATLANQQYAAEEAISDRKKIEEQAGGAKIVELTAEERAQWKQATQEVEKRFAGEIGPELLQRIHSLLDH
ncbi:MAG: DctP family TRAP transporter solute-binding subunit [Gammaproteobacteria bacterium]|nr:DctP family TRAP transporter solute-binding subunit [Gammaproteobacteria bacterium]MCP5424082.1 DctP family TRAP transporter solute-binding subunit [Gammaproteobacteria bacterium]MCP5459477.1 DctP family TRAP transporter solute-binding subunit [Gammaproteobacteria bacterium]